MFMSMKESLPLLRAPNRQRVDGDSRAAGRTSTLHGDQVLGIAMYNSRLQLPAVDMAD
jgi:hypothetical protein